MQKPIGSKVKAAGILLMATSNQPWEFLLLRHPDRWDLPKGHCESGESYRQAALRETSEETGIPADAIQLDPQFVFEISYPVRYRKHGDRVFNKHVCYFLGYLSGKPKLQLTEHPDARWFQWDPPHQIQSETIDPLLAAVAKHLAQHGS